MPSQNCHKVTFEYPKQHHKYLGISGIQPGWYHGQRQIVCCGLGLLDAGDCCALK